MFGLIIGGISSVLSVVAKLAPAVIKIVGTELINLAKAIEAFCIVLGILKPEEDVENIGDKALQAEQDEVNPIKPEDFDSHEKYLEKLREYELDPEKSRKITQDQKLQKGVEVMMGLTIEKLGEAMEDMYRLVLQDPVFYGTPGRLEGIAKAVQNDKETFDDIVGYLSGKSHDSTKNDKAFDALFDVEKAITPEASDRDIMTAVSGMRGKK